MFHRRIQEGTKIFNCCQDCSEVHIPRANSFKARVFPTVEKSFVLPTTQYIIILDCGFLLNKLGKKDV